MKRWLRVLGLSAAGLIGATTASAVTTMGARSCGEWEARASNGYAKVAAEAWVAGAVSGMAVVTGQDILANADGQSISLWMDNYCRAHPLDNTTAGVDALGAELMRRMHR